MNLKMAIAETLKTFRTKSVVTKRETWQGLDVRDRPDMVTHELVGHSLIAELNGRHVGYYVKQIDPDLPWCDDHFVERVSGEPLNPPPSEAWWPHAPKGNTIFKTKEPMQLDERDWAYLAALIDGEGSITFEESTYRPRISISQSNPDFIELLGRRYPFGHVHIRKGDQIIITSRSIDDEEECDYDEHISGVWYMTRRCEVHWVLQKVLPYLELKKDKAEKALEILNAKTPHQADEFRFMEDGKFSHTYPERFWPKYAGNARHPRTGIRYPYGDYQDVINLLEREPYTRQAYLPIWGFEDTGNVNSVRTPCTLGYHFLLTGGKIDITYYIRSCDLVRHWRNDIYFSVRLLLDVLHRLRGPPWIAVQPGTLRMHIASLHCFANDWRALYGEDKSK